MRRFWIAGLSLMAVAAFSTVSAQHGAHEHGVADMRFAVDGQTLYIEMGGALDNLTGFEHEPRDDVQRGKLVQAGRQLEQPETLFVLSPQAQCVLAEMELDLPYSGEGGHQENHGHVDFYAAYRFDCAAPQSLEQIDIRVFDVFPRILRLRTTTATQAGQNTVTLDTGNRRLRLERD